MPWGTYLAGHSAVVEYRSAYVERPAVEVAKRSDADGRLVRKDVPRVDGDPWAKGKGLVGGWALSCKPSHLYCTN
jgi:hypothetical protein